MRIIKIKGDTVKIEFTRDEIARFVGDDRDSRKTLESNRNILSQLEIIEKAWLDKESGGSLKRILRGMLDEYKQKELERLECAIER